MSSSTGTAEKSKSLMESLDDYRKELNTKVKSAGSEKVASAGSYHSALNQLQNKTCSYLKYKAVGELYDSMKQCVTVSAHRKAELVKLSVESLLKKSESLSEQLGALSKELKQVQVESIIVKDLACKIMTCYISKDKSENKTAYAALKKITGFDDKVGTIKTKACNLHEMAGLTFCAAVNVSGFQGFVSLNSLDSHTSGLLDSLGKLQANIDTSCKNVSENVLKTFEEKSEIIKLVAETGFAYSDARCTEKAVCDLWNKTCDPCDDMGDHPTNSKERLAEICQKFKEDFGEENNDDTSKLKAPSKGDGPAY